MNPESKLPSLKDKILASAKAEEETLSEEDNASEESEEEKTEEAKPARKGRGKGRKNKVRR